MKSRLPVFFFCLLASVAVFYCSQFNIVASYGDAEHRAHRRRGFSSLSAAAGAASPGREGDEISSHGRTRSSGRRTRRRRHRHSANATMPLPPQLTDAAATAVPQEEQQAPVATGSVVVGGLLCNRTRRPYHVVMTAASGLYQEWQSRIAYYHYKKQKALHPCSDLGGFTRLYVPRTDARNRPPVSRLPDASSALLAFLKSTVTHPALLLAASITSGRFPTL